MHSRLRARVGSTGAFAPAVSVPPWRRRRLQLCDYQGELDMQTLVWAKGLRFPLGRLGSRLTCRRSVLRQRAPTRTAVAGGRSQFANGVFRALDAAHCAL